MKNKTVYTCSACGFQTPRWLGKCQDCGSWNTLVEETYTQSKSQSSSSRQPSSAAVLLDTVDVYDKKRFLTGMTEFDRVLGGGVVPGSLILVGGDPGIGKSTLLLQLCQSLGKDKKVLYVSGEESQHQIKMRANRLGISTPNLLILTETNIVEILSSVSHEQPQIMIVDSIQTMFSDTIASAPGSVTQVREVTLLLMKLAKQNGIAIFLVGHVTKEGALAGPRVLEHMVDCVLYFEGDRHQSYRIIRAVKNRFGSTNEIGVFEMCNEGLKEVANPSKMLLEGRPLNVPGTCVVCAMEGTRPMLAEVQALVAPSVFGMPRRMATGMDYNRIILLMAVLEKRVGLNLSNQDAYVNFIGGIRIEEPAADLAVTLAIASGFKNFVIDPKTIILGEVGLTGEIRGVNAIEQRVNESEKLGFTNFILPEVNKKAAISGETIHFVKDVRQALQIARSSNK